MPPFAESPSLGIVCVQRNGIRNPGCRTISALVLYLAKLVESPKERPLKARLVASEFAEGVTLLGVGVERASEENLVPVPLAFCLPERLRRFCMRGFVPDYGWEDRSV